MDIAYNTQFQQGDRLILELKNDDIFEGDFANGGKDRIDLLNVIQHNNSNVLSGIYEFYRNEIKEIHIPKSKLTNKEPLKTTTDDGGSNSVCTKIKICEDEYNRLKQMYKDFIYINNADKQYYTAVEHLLESETVGVVWLGMEKDRSANVKLLAMSTWKQVYIFDLINHEQRYFYPEIKDILESEAICKVMHKGSGFVDILYRWHKIYVQNTFDTQIVDLIIEKNKSGECSKDRSISDCLVQYLNFPESLLKDATEVSNKSWLQRPLSSEKRLYASQLVTYLILLKDHLQKALLSDVYKAINNVHDLVYDLDDYKFSQYMLTSKVPKEVDELIPILKQHKISKKTHGEIEITNGGNKSNHPDTEHLDSNRKTKCEIAVTNGDNSRDTLESKKVVRKNKISKPKIMTAG